MPAKHSARTFGAARAVLSFAVAVLVLLVVWVAVRAVGPAEAKRQPTVVLPSAPLIIPTAPSTSPSAVSTTAPASSPTPVTTSASPKTRKPTPRSASPSPSPSPSRAKAKAAAVLRVSGGRGEGYMAGVRVENTGTVPLKWRVTVSHDDDDEVRLRGTWNASGSENGDNLVFSGGTLQPGASVSFGYQATHGGRGDLRPTGCSVVGGTCGMS